VPTTTITTPQTVWDCRYSRLGYRLANVDEHLQPESLWVCVRTGTRRNVTNEECAICPHWEPLPERAAVY